MQTCWCYKTLLETAPSDRIFEKEVIFHEFDFEISKLDFEVTKSSIWKHKTSFDKGFFFHDYYLATLTTNLS